MQRGILGGSLILALALLGSLAGSAAADTSVTVAVQPINGSNVSGTAVLTAQGNQTAVSLKIGGYPANSSHPIHFHTGTCANPGPPVIPLPNMDANADGQAAATAVVNVPLTSLTDGNHFIMTHTGPPPAIGTNIGCGDVPTIVAAPLMPKSGGMPPWGAAIVVGLGFAAVGAGARLRRRGPRQT
jgi:hypothetical protein